MSGFLNEKLTFLWLRAGPVESTAVCWGWGVSRYTLADIRDGVCHVANTPCDTQGSW